MKPPFVPSRILQLDNEYSRKCLIVKVARKLIHKDVLDLFYERGVPVHTHQIMALSL